jgi:hypothetical protein
MYITNTSDNKSEYNILSGNTINICAILYHIFILLFNNYYIQFTIDNTEKYYEHAVLLNLLKENLIYCQIITLFTAASIIISEEISFVILQNKILAKENSENMKFVIMFISYLIKSSFSIYQLMTNVIDTKYIEYNYKIIDNEIISLILVSYNIRLLPFILLIVLTVTLTVGFILKKTVYCILHEMRKYLITYTPIPIEYIDNTNL